MNNLHELRNIVLSQNKKIEFLENYLKNISEQVLDNKNLLSIIKETRADSDTTTEEIYQLDFLKDIFADNTIDINDIILKQAINKNMDKVIEIPSNFFDT